MYTESQTILLANATWTSPPRMSNLEDNVAGIVAADQAGSLVIEQSFDPRAEAVATAGSANWTTTATVAVSAADNKTFSTPLVAPFWRVKYTNGATNQGSFRIFARHSSTGVD